MLLLVSRGSQASLLLRWALELARYGRMNIGKAFAAKAVLLLSIRLLVSDSPQLFCIMSYFNIFDMVRLNLLKMCRKGFQRIQRRFQFVSMISFCFVWSRFQYSERRFNWKVFIDFCLREGGIWMAFDSFRRFWFKSLGF